MNQQELDVGLTITFDRANSTYKQNDWVTGKVKLEGDVENSKFEIYGLKIKAEGTLQAQNKASNRDLEAVSAHLIPLKLFTHESSIAEMQYVDKDNCEFTFKFKLMANEGEKLIETYVGVYVTVGYEIQAELKLANYQIVKETQNFFVQVNGAGRDMLNTDKYPNPQSISINPDKLKQGSMEKMPRIKIQGVINSDVCMINNDFTGQFELEECEGKIRSIDLQLIRVEQVSNAKGKFQEATEIQLIQVCDGNITKGIEIPLTMMFPKYFCCPNFQWKDFTVEFEVNFIVILYDAFKITLNYPIKLLRN
ncbi:vacuolar protein sorting-associated protein (macronuclear) [Tetrahymena thermophila SB210]|uniref:Vacuolar protein sorting-associated protein n=1 Tax=Tetrahymena thermophila (strain SB210) TaxID=312017 RepID=I7LZY1_TETTS|nr:vacuolar protein sorting-associated protein [Tetrahymena thermophila SB210]EAR85122.2 vacuolar protein sorting-associated protein [Tetrahymena thermophila SB210]|eukprot:XP_001032785.2 vacuolar protein sorting-associated protein [Tetrahymena thermophila SB210]